MTTEDVEVTAVLREFQLQRVPLAREVVRLRHELAAARIAIARADGALADAETVPTGNLEVGIRTLTAQRDVLLAGIHPGA